MGRPGTRDLVAEGEVEDEELVAFVDGPVEERVEGLRRWGRRRGSGDGGDFGCGDEGGAVVSAFCAGGVQEIFENLVVLFSCATARRYVLT